MTAPPDGPSRAKVDRYGDPSERAMNHELVRDMADECASYTLSILSARRKLARAFDAGRADLKREVLAQIEEVDAAGIRPDDPSGYFESAGRALQELKRRVEEL